MQVVDVLGHHQHPARPFAGEARQRLVRGVGEHPAPGQPAAPGVVERVHRHRIAGEGLGRGHVLEAHLGPDAVGVAEGVEAGLFRNAGAREDDDVPLGCRAH